jgi:hypothetical protein
MASLAAQMTASRGRTERMVDAAPSASQPFNPSPSGQLKAQQGAECKLFGSGSAHRDEVADVAIVAVGGRRISVFLISARARVGVVNARFGVARSAGDGNHSANSTAEHNSRECIGQYAWAYPAILVNGGGYEQ